MKISAGKQVSIEFKLHLENAQGEVVEETQPGDPFVFTYIEDPMLEGFEKALEGLAAGESFSVSINADEAYGPERTDLVVEMPKETFMGDDGVDEDLIAEGEVVPMTDDQGNEFLGLIVENKLNSVIIDFNHPLAGENLHFEGKILEVIDPASN